MLSYNVVLIVFAVIVLSWGINWYEKRHTLKKNHAHQYSPCKAQDGDDVEATWLQQYTSIVCIDNLRSLYSPEGWLALGDRESLTSLEPGTTIIGIVGEYNRGKSHVLSRLCKVPFAQGMTSHTEGISLKHMKLSMKSSVIIDTKGLNSPVPRVTDQLLQDKKSEEELLRDVVFDLADIWLYVVNRLSAQEQLEIYQLSRDIEDGPRKGKAKVVVIHNLKDVEDPQELVAASTKLVTETYQDTLVVQHTPLSPGVIATSFHGKQDSSTTLMEHQIHLVLGKEDSPAGVNNSAVYEYLEKMVLFSVDTRRGNNFWEMLQDSLERKLPKYIFFPGNVKPKLATKWLSDPNYHNAVFKIDRGTMRIDTSGFTAEEIGALTLKERDLGYFISRKTTLLYEKDLRPTELVYRIAIPGLASKAEITWPAFLKEVDESDTGGYLKIELIAPPWPRDRREPFVFSTKIPYNIKVKFETDKDDEGVLVLKDGILVITLPRSVRQKPNTEAAGEPPGAKKAEGGSGELGRGKEEVKKRSNRSD